jgi:mono/diheme cytochrome c family protein
MWWRALTLGVLAGFLFSIGSRADEGNDPTLRFLRDGQVVKTLTRAELEKGCGTEVPVDDPYYGRTVRYRACPLATVLEMGFGVPATDLASSDVVFRAKDGYAKPASGARLAEPGGYVAFADAARAHGDDPGFEPIDRKQVDPAPFYLVWSKPEQRDTHRYPWPYQLAEIEIVSLDQRYPHIAPTGAAPGSMAREGFEIFKTDCIACHAINGEGGKVGPDLNVPKNILEYRPAEQVKQYIQNPQSFRYTSMPAHPYLTPLQLDALISYFDVMRTLKHDPGPGS